MKPKYPNITVKLVGHNGNAMNVIGITMGALRHGGVSREEIDAFTKDAMSGDYDHVLQTCMAWVNVK